MAFVVAVWAAYFVPLVLRRYDEASTASSLESLSPLSRVIARRTGAGDEDAATDEDVPEQSPAEPVASRPAPTRRAAVIAARRRRRTLISLLTILAVVAGLAAASVIAPLWVLAPVGLVAAWLVACRVQVRAERGLSRAVSRPRLRLPRVGERLRAAAQRSPSADRGVEPRLDPADEETIVVSGQYEDVDPARPHVMQQDELSVDALDEQVVIAVPSIATSGEALWDPLPVTLPTYVTKPRVGRTVRTIDFDSPGTWTSGHVEGEDVELPGRPRSEADSPQRRAAGE